MTAPVTVFDDLLQPQAHAAIWGFLNQPGWAHGGHSSQDAEADIYFYKHFAGYLRDGPLDQAPGRIEDELARNAPILAEFWSGLKKGPLKDQALARCYANAMPGGIEGSLHLDSNIETHLTAIYYSHPAWEPDFAGETLLFNATGNEVLAAIYPLPNRLAVFSSVIPHVARPMSRRAPGLRVTLMFKTTPA